MARKCDWRFAPKTVVVHEGRTFSKRPVARAEIHSPGRHAGSAINPAMTAVQLITDTGKSRWFGVDDARIASNLRIVACGGFINPQNELAKEWKRCGTVCDNLQGAALGRSRKRRRRH